MSWIGKATRTSLCRLQTSRGAARSAIRANAVSISPSARRHYTQSRWAKTGSSPDKTFKLGLLGALTTVAATAGLYSTLFSENIQSDASTDTVSVVKSVDPLPTKITTPLLTTFDLIGYGVREVSFLKFQVYALGLYIAEDDLALVKKILSSRFIESFYEDIQHATTPEEHRDNLSRALNDPSVSNILIRNLLTSGVRFTARICAVRNTDLSHLRDGFIRTIKNNPNYSKLMKSEDETVGERITKGLEDLRDTFNSAKMSAKKNSLVFMEIDENQHIRVTVEAIKKSATGERAPPVVLGTVKEPLVTELLFESYAGAEKPLIQSVQTITSQSIVDAVC